VTRADTLGFRRSPSRPRLSVDNVGQIGLGVAGGSSGTGFAGGAALLWSDMLGDHSLETALQVVNAGGSVANNTAALIAYQNMKSRLNWGLQASQLPTISSQFVEDVVVVGGQPVLRDRLFRFWQVDRSFAGGVAYPFSRFRRIELSGGIRHIGFASQVESRFYDQGGALIDKTTENLPDSIGGLTLGTAGFALVSDQSVFGGTSPVLGHRSRLEVDPSFGSLRFTEVLADVRQYVPVARPLVLAGRILHYGRYGPDSDDFRLVPLFIGYPSLVRGYNEGSFDVAEPVFDRLLGTRIAVANLEARLPLLGGLGVIPSGGVPPVELAAFFDAGTAWYHGQKPSFAGGDVSTITSHGAALRVNLFGFAVGEVDLVHPNDRPGKGWFWQFSLQPGF